jgi:hypothetical protein
MFSTDSTGKTWNKKLGSMVGLNSGSATHRIVGEGRPKFMSSNDPFEQATKSAEAELAEIAKKLEGYQVLKARKYQLETFIRAARRLKSGAVEEPPASSDSQTEDPDSTPILSMQLPHSTKVPLWKFIETSIRDVTGPLSAKEVLEIISSKGREVNGTYPAETVRGAMILKPDIFERMPDGKFKLRNNEAQTSPNGHARHEARA